MKKLIYIANARIPTEKAHGLAIMKMCEAFAKQGLEVELVAPRRLNPIKEDPFEYYGVERNFKITRLPTIDLIFLGKIGYWIQALSFAEFVSWYCLFKKADVYYGRDEIALFYLTLFKKNVFWEAHTAKDNSITRSLVKRLKGLVVISRGLKDFYASLGFNEKKILVAHSGVDIEQFENIKSSKKELRKSLGLPIDKKIVAYVGKLETMGMSKGTEGLKETFKRLSEQDPNIYPLIVHNVSPKLVPKYMKAVDVLVMNYPDEEHFARYMSPLKLFEYMASGIPIVTSDIPTIREILDESMTTLFKPNDFSGLESSIMKVLGGPIESEEKAKKAKEIVYEYTWDNRGKNILNFLI